MSKKPNLETKKRIIIDLDVITLAFWDKKDEAKIIERTQSGKFYMVTPYIILEHLSRWNHRKLAVEIASFYEVYSSQIVTAQNILDKSNDMGVDYKELLFKLVNLGVKEEDVVLVIISSIFDVDYLVTFNKKHLRNKEKEINEVLRKNGIKTIKIVFPEEI